MTQQRVPPPVPKLASADSKASGKKIMGNQLFCRYNRKDNHI